MSAPNGSAGGTDDSSSAGIPSDVHAAVKHLHSLPPMCVVHVTGGAASSLSWLLSVPGASSTIIEASVPYSHTSLRALLRRHAPTATIPSSAASAATATALAAAAYATAAAAAPHGTPVVGVGAACALASSRPLRGGHRAHVVARSDVSETRYELRLDQAALRTRVQEDALASRLVVQALLDACAVPSIAAMSFHPMGLLRASVGPGDKISAPEVHEVGDAVEAVLQGDGCVAEMDGRGMWRVGGHSATVVLPGSFNPLHDGHRGMLESARRILPEGTVVGFEISVANPDKPALDADVVRERAAQFRGSKGDSPPVLVLTSAPLFSEKAAQLPGTVFVVGYDTAVRICEPKYYGGDAGLVEALVGVVRNGCSFLVAGRRATPSSGEFLTLDDVAVPRGFESLFRAIPETEFRLDISSTQLREKRERGERQR